MDAAVLTLTFGQPAEALTETVDNTLALRVTPDTLAIVGIEVLGFQQHSQVKPAFLQLLLAALQQPGSRIESQPLEAGGTTLTRLGDNLRDLVAV